LETLAEREEETVIIVTHGGTTSNIVAWWLGLKLDWLTAHTPFTGGPGSVHLLRTNRLGNRVVDRLNDQTHLHAAALGGVLEL
jgi:broad specificity phosphatase PhoE